MTTRLIHVLFDILNEICIDRLIVCFIFNKSNILFLS